MVDKRLNVFSRHDLPLGEPGDLALQAVAFERTGGQLRDQDLGRLVRSLDCRHKIGDFTVERNEVPLQSLEPRCLCLVWPACCRDPRRIKAPEAVTPPAALLRDRPDDRARISPCCFDPEIAAELVRPFTAAPVGLIAAGGLARNARPGRRAGRVARTVRLGIDRALVSKAQQRGLDFSVWMVNTPEQLRDVLALGVNGFTTDHPADIAANLANELIRTEEAASWTGASGGPGRLISSCPGRPQRQ